MLALEVWVGVGWRHDVTKRVACSPYGVHLRAKAL